jgi:CHASE3 domain sensor protein
LESTLRALLADENRRAELGRNAKNVVHENLGAMERTVDMIVKHLDGEVLQATRGKSENVERGA